MHAGLRLLATSGPRISWNLFHDIDVMWRYTFMVNAFRAGTAVAVLTAVVGWFMVARRQAFVGHTLAVVGFPGSAAAALAGVSVALGSFVACVIAALIVGGLSIRDVDRGPREDAALVGLVQAAALATGYLFVSRFHGNLEGTNALLFGSFLGITSAQVLALVAITVVTLIAIAAAYRPLLFTSIDPSGASALRLPSAGIGVGFLVVLGLSAAAASQITGSLLVFALLVLPPATARRFTLRPGVGMGIAVGLALAITWAGLTLAFYTPWPIGFWVTSIAFGVYVAVHGVHAIAHRGRHRRHDEALT